MQQEIFKTDCPSQAKRIVFMLLNQETKKWKFMTAFTSAAEHNTFHGRRITSRPTKFEAYSRFLKSKC